MPRCSPESIVQARNTKRLNFIKKLNFAKYEKYADRIVNCGHVEKKNKLCTLREYYQFFIDGYNTSSIKKKLGYDRHLISFYNALLRDRVVLSEDVFEQEYLSGMSLDEIADKHSIEREFITFLRELYGIKRKGSSYINRKKTELPLTNRQKQIIYGCLMGDGYKMSMSSFKAKQSTKQKDYLHWKHEELKEHVIPYSYQMFSEYDKRYKKNYEYVRFYTMANTEIETILHQFYGTGKKIITTEILDNLDDLSLAIWYMDDGMTDHYYRSEWNVKTTGTLCTDDFGFEQCQLMAKWFKDKYNIIAMPHIVKKNNKLCRLKFNGDNTEKLFNIISPYVIESMRYKIDYDAYLIYRRNREEAKKNKVWPEEPNNYMQVIGIPNMPIHKIGSKKKNNDVV